LPGGRVELDGGNISREAGLEGHIGKFNNWEGEEN
jgi:hypothetical protein